jgi:hypothetical protein
MSIITTSYATAFLNFSGEIEPNLVVLHKWNEEVVAWSFLKDEDDFIEDYDIYHPVADVSGLPLRTSGKELFMKTGQWVKFNFPKSDIAKTLEVSKKLRKRTLQNLLSAIKAGDRAIAAQLLEAAQAEGITIPIKLVRAARAASLERVESYQKTSHKEEAKPRARGGNSKPKGRDLGVSTAN